MSGVDTLVNIKDVFTIPEDGMSILRKKIKKLNRKAIKLGCGEVEIINHGSKIVKTSKDGIDLPVHHRYFEIEIKGEAPTLDGWRFIGTLDFTDDIALVKSAPGQTIPEEYRVLKDARNCDHCHNNRRRNKSMIIQHTETGKYKQVGSTCLKDFFGYNDPKKIAQYLENYHRVITDICDERTYDNVCFSPLFDLVQLLAITAVIVKNHGYVSGVKAMEDDTQMSTSARLSDYFYNKSKQVREWALEIKNQITNEHYDLADSIIEWIKKEDNNSDYFYNLKNIANASDGMVSGRMFGYVASMGAAYHRATEAKKVYEAKSNEHVGIIKKREVFKIALTNITVKEGYYGTTWIHRFEDNEGNSLVWFSSKDVDFRVGNEYTVKATVKKHDEYKGRKQTLINRVVNVEL